MSGGLMSLLYDGAIHAREQGKIDAARIRTASANRLAASNSSLAQWEQSFRNQQRLKFAGKQADNINENISRNLDAAASGRAMSRLAAAEELGANIASAAAAGVGGSSIDTFNSTARLSQAIREEQEDRGLATDLYGAGQARADVFGEAIESQDAQIFQANLDYTTYIDHKKMSSTRKLLSFAAAAGATYFAGPQAGAAVLDFADAGHRAANGDIDGSAARMTSALQSGMLGVQSFTKSGNTPWGRTLWDSVKKRQESAAGARLRI